MAWLTVLNSTGSYVKSGNVDRPDIFSILFFLPLKIMIFQEIHTVKHLTVVVVVTLEMNVFGHTSGPGTPKETETE